MEVTVERVTCWAMSLMCCAPTILAFCADNLTRPGDSVEPPAWAHPRPAANARPNRERHFAFVGLDPNDTSQDYLEHGIPTDAVKAGPFMGMGHGMEVVRYLRRDTKELVAVDDLFLGVVTARMLYKDGIQHGISKRWYKNGKPMSAIPYKKGIMHGVCKHWDEAGNLVGCYRIENGGGLAVVCFSNGRLESVIPYGRNAKNGLAFAFYDNGQVRAVRFLRDGRLYGPCFNFYEGGKLERWRTADATGALDGPDVGQDEHNDRAWVQYYIRGERVSDQRYEQEAKKDLRLPAFKRDPKDYLRDVVPAEVKALIEHYKNLPPVTIPLEYKEEGVTKP
jgi:antitoxin component YwqK of YwqJK toxin-antitoxin module